MVSWCFWDGLTTRSRSAVSASSPTRSKRCSVSTPRCAWRLTPSGRVHRRSLPAPELDRAELSEAYAEPRTATESTLVAIWADVLRLKRVGIYDDFFQLGGHSLLAAQVAARVRDAFQAE